MKKIVTRFLYLTVAASSTIAVHALFDLSVVNTKNIRTCNTGDNITTVSGEYNQVQIARVCDRIVGSTGSAELLAPELLPRLYSSVMTTQGVNEISITIPRQPKTIGYKVTKKIKDIVTGKNIDGTITLLLRFSNESDGTARLTTYTSSPWAGQLEGTWTRRIVTPFKVALQELGDNQLYLTFMADGKVIILIGDPDGENLQETINLFDPRAV
jgi:hypothetical protein